MLCNMIMFLLHSFSFLAVRQRERQYTNSELVSIVEKYGWLIVCMAEAHSFRLNTDRETESKRERNTKSPLCSFLFEENRFLIYRQAEVLILIVLGLVDAPLSSSSCGGRIPAQPH